MYIRVRRIWICLWISKCKNLHCYSLFCKEEEKAWWLIIQQKTSKHRNFSIFNSVSNKSGHYIISLAEEGKHLPAALPFCSMATIQAHASVLLHSQLNWSKWLLCSLPDLTFIHSECSGDCARSDAIVLLYFSNVKACQEQGEAVNKLFLRVWGPYSLWSRNNQSQEVRLDFLQRVQFLTCCQLTLYSKERSSAGTHPERALGSR